MLIHKQPICVLQAQIHGIPISCLSTPPEKSLHVGRYIGCGIGNGGVLRRHVLGGSQALDMCRDIRAHSWKMERRHSQAPLQAVGRLGGRTRHLCCRRRHGGGHNRGWAIIVGSCLQRLQDVHQVRCSGIVCRQRADPEQLA